MPGLSGFGLSWEEIKQKLQTEGSFNKTYDSDIDGVLNDTAVPDLWLNKQRWFWCFETGSVSTATGGSGLIYTQYFRHIGVRTGTTEGSFARIGISSHNYNFGMKAFRALLLIAFYDWASSGMANSEGYVIFSGRAPDESLFPNDGYIGIYMSNGKVYARTHDGSAYTETLIQIYPSNKNWCFTRLLIEANTSSVKFYNMQGYLLAEHTTNIPNLNGYHLIWFPVLYITNTASEDKGVFLENVMVEMEV